MAPKPARLTITFHKVGGHRPGSWWEAVRPRGGRFTGGHMPIGRHVIPHDLGHLVAEAHLGIDDGMWGLLARGATFKRGTGQRPTRTGRALVRDHRAALHRAEHVGNAHQFLWLHGEPTPVAPTYERVAAAWRSVPDGGTLTVRWPTLELETGPAQPAAGRLGISAPTAGGTG
jgi:hypothetical protein